MPVAELRVSFRPLRASAVLMVDCAVARHGQQVSELAAGYQPYATLPGRTEALLLAARRLDHGAVVDRPRRAAPVDDRPVALVATITGRRPVEEPALPVPGMPVPYRPEERGARAEAPLIAALRTRERGAARRWPQSLARRPIERGGQAVPFGPAGTRPQERDAVRSGSEPTASRKRDRLGRAGGRPSDAWRPHPRHGRYVPQPSGAVRDVTRWGGAKAEPAWAERLQDRPGGPGGGQVYLLRDPQRQADLPWWLPRWDRDLVRSGWAYWPRWLTDRFRGEVVILRPRLFAVRTDLRPVVLVTAAPWADRWDERVGRVADKLQVLARDRLLAGMPVPLPVRAGRRRSREGAFLGAHWAGWREADADATFLTFWRPGMRRPELDAVVPATPVWTGRVDPVRAAAPFWITRRGTRPTGLGGVVFGRLETGRGEARGAVLAPARTGLRDVQPGAVVVPLGLMAVTDWRAAMVLAAEVASAKAPKPAALPVLWRARLRPKPAALLLWPPLAGKEDRPGAVVGGTPAEKAPKDAALPFFWTAGRPPLEAVVEVEPVLLDYGNAAPYVPRPEDNERPYDPAEDWDETEPIAGPYNPPADPVTDPETGEIISPPPQEHVEPPPNAIVDPVTGEPRYPTGRTDPATGDPEILPPDDPTGIPGWLVPPYEQDVQEGVLLEFLLRFWDVWQAYQVYYGHLTGREAIRHLVGELRRWIDENPDSPEHEAIWWDFLNCARAAAMRYCPTYLRRVWRQERYAVVDYETDAFNAGHFREPGRWIVDGWTFRYHVEPTDWALAPEKDRAAVLLGCNLPHGGWVDFEYLVAAGNAMRLVAVPSGQVLWEAQGTIEDPYGKPGPHAAVAVPPGTTALRWEFLWGHMDRQEAIEYGTDAFNGNTFMDPTRWVSSGAGWTFQRQNDPDEYTDDIALAPQGDGAVVALEVDLPDGGRVEFEYGVADGNHLELVAMPSGQVLWSSGGTGVDPYGVPGPTAAVEMPPGTTRIGWRFTGTAVPPSGLRAYIDVVTVYRYTLQPVTPPSGLAGILDVVTLWRYEVRDVLVGAYPETVCEPNRGNDAVRDAWECFKKKWEERHQGKSLRRIWLVT